MGVICAVSCPPGLAWAAIAQFFDRGFNSTSLLPLSSGGWNSETGVAPPEASLLGLSAPLSVSAS